MDAQKLSVPALIGETLEDTGNGAVESKESRKSRNQRSRTVEASSFDGSIKKKRGAQPGNTNALKHGLYVHHRTIRNTTPIEKAVLYDLTDHIQHMKDYLLRLYEIGMKSTDLEEINNTTRSLAVGYIALGRLIHIHDDHSSIPLPADLLGVDFNDMNFRSDRYQDPSLAEIVAKLKKLIS